MSETRRPIFGAKVILLRPTERGGFEAFLMRDPDDTSRVGFPGGPVTKEDYSSGMLNRCRGLSAAYARIIIGARFTPREASGPWVAGIRNLFIEAGFLLAVNETGQDPMLDPEWTVRLQNQRDALGARTSSFGSFLVQQGLWADASKLVYFSSWRTASHGTIGRENHFYLAAIGQDPKRPSPPLPRVVRGFWLSPDQAVRLCDRRELLMDFSTFASVRTLADFNSVQSLFQAYGSGRRE